MQFILFLGLFLGLFLFSRALTSSISFFFMKLTRSHTLAIQFLATLFLPGVIIHELSHWLIANILFVPTGTIEFFPQAQGDSVKLGSVQIGRTDLFRRFAIGVAPVIGGLLVMLGIFWFLSPSFYPITWKTVVFLAVVFEIGNTMFSSSKDLEGAIGFGIIALLLFTLLLFLNVPVISYLEGITKQPIALSLFQTLNSFFVIAIGIDVVVVGLLHLITPRRTR